MNLNDYPEELKVEEQKSLDKLITKMDKVIVSLDDNMKQYVQEAKNADISVNPDLYLSKIMAQQGIKNTNENRKKFLRARDELYTARLLLHYKDEVGEGTQEIKVGLHSCIYRSDHLVASWTQPLCRHYLLDNPSAEYESIVKDKNGEESHTHYKLLAKSQVKLRFTRVIKAMNMFPGIFDDQELKMMKGNHFFSDTFLERMIDNFDPDKYDPDTAATIISDEFLQELLERRSNPEFKNIVFSIQEKQGEIIQAPYRRDMIVQGCAGSGKSMIMMHRLPILLYDNPNSLMRTELYIITPSQMYVQMAENMRYQLEISDIQIGTVGQYYDYCISKYPGHREGEYGRISYSSKTSREDEKYVYSERCIEDIKAYFEELVAKIQVPMEEAYAELKLKKGNQKSEKTYSQIINNRLLVLQPVIDANNDVLKRYFSLIYSTIEAFRALKNAVYYRKDGILREMSKMISSQKERIETAQKEITKLDPQQNAIAIRTRESVIEAANKRIEELQEQQKLVYADISYFDSLNEINDKIDVVLEPFSEIKEEYSENPLQLIYKSIENIGNLVGGYFMVSWYLSRLEDKYTEYLTGYNNEENQLQQKINLLQKMRDQYLKYDYICKINDEKEALSSASANVIKDAYTHIMSKIGIEPDKKGNLKALRCSPYIYLQAIYLFQGAPTGKKESLLAVDEAQGIAPEELRLMKNLNGNNVIFNLYGDIYQHVEDTKGVESWDEFRGIINFDLHEMQENYRNASQITEYCKRVFGIDMKAINTPGKGVHELHGEEAFNKEMINQLLDDQKVGLAAIIVGSDAEARYLLGTFSTYKDKFHDMTDEDFSIHHTRWNIINIDDAKGLEFSSVIVLAGRMTRNQKYIAFTRALDDLYVYSDLIDITGYEEKPEAPVEEKDDGSGDSTSPEDHNPEYTGPEKKKKSNSKKPKSSHNDSEVRKFFEGNGLEVMDLRDEGGKLWVVGEKEAIRDIVNLAINKFTISGKYASSKEINNKKGWYTKTDK